MPSIRGNTQAAAYGEIGEIADCAFDRGRARSIVIRTREILSHCSDFFPSPGIPRPHPARNTFTIYARTQQDIGRQLRRRRETSIVKSIVQGGLRDYEKRDTIQRNISARNAVSSLASLHRGNGEGDDDDSARGADDAARR